jgi:hypothetical protein
LVQAAFEQPLFYPRLKEFLFPGDTLAILLQSSLPDPRSILQPIIQYCLQMKVDPNDIAVVITDQMASQFGITQQQRQQSESEIANGSPPSIFPITVDSVEIGFQVHDPANTYGLAYLAANEAGDPVHINRLLADADVVIPVGCPTPRDQFRQDCLYPDFGSTDRLEQFRAGAGSVSQRESEIQLANDHLGTFFTVEIVVAPGGEVAAVFAGARNDVIVQTKHKFDELWTVDFIPHGKTVVATIENAGGNATWDDFIDAVIASANISNGDGPIVLWTDIDQTADRKTRKALLSQFDDTISSKFSVGQRTLASIVSERPIFLRSKLSQSQTEELGLGFLSTEEEVLNLVSQFNSGVLLRDAHRCRINQPSPTPN